MSTRILIRRMYLVCYDIAAVALSSYLALLLRFDMHPNQIPPQYLTVLWATIWISMLGTVVIFAAFRLYSSLWTYAGTTEMMYVVSACVVDALLNMVVILLNHREQAYPLPRSFYMLYGVFLLAFTICGRYSYRGLRAIRARLSGDRSVRRNVMLIGADAAGSSLIKEIINSRMVNKNLVGVIDDDPGKQGTFIHGIRVIGTRDDIIRRAEELEVDEIMIALPSASAKEIKEIVDICKETGCELKRLPGIYQLVNGEVSISKLKEVDVNDLLGREPVCVDLDSIMGYVSDKVILVTGGGGSIGSELCRQIASRQPKQKTPSGSCRSLQAVPPSLW